MHASASVPAVSGQWKRYTVTLATGSLAPSLTNRFVISAAHPGKVWFSLVSLFPPTYNNRTNGNRIDLMRKLADMHPAFLRFPGGNYLEGDTIADRFDWKKTLGDIAIAPGHRCCWNYPSSDGMGLLEYLEWCEDLHMEPVLAVYAGYSLRGEHVNPGKALEPSCRSPRRNRVRHRRPEHHVGRTARPGWPPRAIPLTLCRDRQRGLVRSLAQLRWTLCAVLQRHQGQVPGTPDHRHHCPSRRRRPMWSTTTTTVRPATDCAVTRTTMTNTDRSGPKIFVGEWASTEGSPTPTLQAALGDAAWLTGLERNARYRADLLLCPAAGQRQPRWRGSGAPT